MDTAQLSGREKAAHIIAYVFPFWCFAWALFAFVMLVISRDFAWLFAACMAVNAFCGVSAIDGLKKYRAAIDRS